MIFSLWDFFTHPLLRGPMLATFFLCIASSLMGVILFFQRRALLGEVLSHAAYPGILIGVSLFSFLWPGSEMRPEWFILGGGALSAFWGLKAIGWMERRAKVYSDTALMFILSTFFGVGVTLAAALQLKLPKLYIQVQTVLFGQAATMDDMDILIYGLLCVAILSFLFFAFRPIQAHLFDSEFSKSANLPVKILEKILVWLFLISLILGVRSVGVLLISGMSIAPAIAARQFSNRLQTVFLIAALFGGLSGLIGNVLSVWGTLAISTPTAKLALPTGPMIIVTSAFFAFMSLLFAPKRGWLFRLFRIYSFRQKCLEENILKEIWKKGEATWKEINFFHRTAPFFLWRGMRSLQNGGWVEKGGKIYRLTPDGLKKGASIVRLHRLWELYLASELGLGRDQVHVSAEEMEHILTPELEKKLTRILSNPELDPHDQLIPGRPTL
jgi:manganese/zinc/iron transport system permease protein